MTDETFFPTFRYSPECPAGRKFTDRDEFEALGPEWVDSPAKLTPKAVTVRAAKATKGAA